MAKSIIIQELVADKCSLSVTMRRLYTILSDLNDKDLMQWISKELNGYNTDDEIPNYRIIKCMPYGDYEYRDFSSVTNYQNRPLPMIDMKEDLKKQLTSMKLDLSISALETSIDEYAKGKLLSISIPMEYWNAFEHGTNITVTKANRIAHEPEMRGCLEKIKNKVLDILLLLEKKFGNLDDLDINVNEYKNSELTELKNCFSSVVYKDCTFQDFSGKIKSKNLSFNDSKIDNGKSKNIVKNSNIGRGKNSIEKYTEIDTNVTIQKTEKKKDCFLKRLFKSRRK